MNLIASIYGQDIGVLSEKKGGVFFEYFSTFDGDKLQISPHVLPFNNSVYTPNSYMTLKMPGVFYDSLPDRFGNQMMSEYFRLKGLGDYIRLSDLQKLAYIGAEGIGAIEYRPAEQESDALLAIELKSYVANVRKALSGTADEVTSELALRHPSPGGARPKASVLWDSVSDKMYVGKGYTEHNDLEHWIIKFDEADRETTVIEKIYFEIAKSAGLNVPETVLIESNDERHFAIKRFDRVGSEKIHQHTLAGMTNSDFMELGTTPYASYLRLAKQLTNDSREQKEAFRRMVFNVIGKNCDDHLKNFSFSMNCEGEWSLSPAYDLVYSNGDAAYGEHAMTINGKVRDITLEDLAEEGGKVGLKLLQMQEIIKEVAEAFNGFGELALEYGLSTKMKDEINSNIERFEGEVFPSALKIKARVRRRGREYEDSVLKGIK